MTMEWQSPVLTLATRKSYWLGRKRKFSSLKLNIGEINFACHQFWKQAISKFGKGVILFFKNSLLGEYWSTEIVEFSDSIRIRNCCRDILHGAT